MPADTAVAWASLSWTVRSANRTSEAASPGVATVDDWPYVSMTGSVMTGILCLNLCLDLPDILFLIRERFVHLFNELVGQFLYDIGPVLREILANLVLLLVALDLLHAVAA